MLFKSSVPHVLNKMNGELYSSTTSARKKEAARRLNYFHSSQLDELESLLSQYFSEPEKLQKVCLNIVRKIIVNLSACYLQPPVRELIDATDSDKKIYAEILENSAFDARIKQASRYTKLLGNTLLRPVWRNGSIALDCLCGNVLDVEVGDSPEELVKVMITDYGNTDKIEDIEYSLWTAETFQRLDFRGNAIQEAENPYGVLPFVSAFAYLPTSSGFWLECNEDLISCQEAINLKITDLMYLITQQSFGIGWIRGAEGGGTMRLDPGTLVELGEKGELGFTSQKAQITSVVHAIDKLMKWCAVSYGLSASTMATDPTSSNRQSGISKLYDSKELAEQRLDDVSMWKGIERQLFNLIRTVFNTHTTKTKLSKNCSLKINFVDPTSQSTSAKEQSETWQNLLDLEVISPVDIAMARDADLTTREDALAFLIKVREEIKALTE